jgi:integrase
MLTDRAIRALATEKRQEDFRVGSVPGLMVRVSKTGRKTFMYLYEAPPTTGGGKRRQRRITIGSYPAISLAEATAKAKGYQGDVARGIDPQGSDPASPAPAPEPQALEDARLKGILGPIQPHPGTFAQLATEYLLRHAWVVKKRTRDDESVLRRDLIPKWGARPAGEIRKRDVVALLDGIVARGAPIAARNTRMLVSKVFNFGISRDLVEHNPTLGVAAPPARTRDVWLRDQEIQTLWKELDRRQLVTASIFRAILLTMQRPGEVSTIEWSEISGSWWEIPPEKAKNGERHRVYLARHMQAILALLRPVTGRSRFVFQSPVKEGKPTTFINKVGRSIATATGLSFTPHDLRRTGATHLAELGFPNEVIDAVLNHKRQGIVRVYNRYGYDAEKEEALSAWDAKIGRLVGSPLA